MCGICGIYGAEDRPLIERMILALRHRGPDDAGIYTNTNISMGHARLSIIDLSEKGRQPMGNENGDIWLCVNGEIYNFFELRAGLEKKGHRFYSNSDSEVIIHAYEEHGISFLEHLRGMFALALYDETKDRLILARDPIGKKPLYYYFNDGVLIFASEIKAILEAGIEKKVDRGALWSYLAYHYTLGEQTLFSGIKKVLPGNMLILEKGQLTVQKYWDLEENIIQASEDYFVKKLRSLLEESVKLRMIADVPIGAFLSGGIDSSAVVALARPHVKNEFHTFSVGFETFSELEYAKIVSNHLGTTHHEIIVTADMVKNDLYKIAWHYDEPLGDAAVINNYYLAQEARKHVKVVLAGEGGDELFGGYDNYQWNLKNSIFFALPSITRKVANFCLDLLPGKGNVCSFTNRAHKFGTYYCQTALEDAHLCTTRGMSDAEINHYTSVNTSSINELINKPPEMKNTLNRLLALDCKNLLPEKFLMKADKATMANSIEERLPLLDKEIIEFAFTIPSSLKIKGGQEKYILKKSVDDLLPPEIISRKKQGFGTPVNVWLNGSLKETVYETLSKGELLRETFKKNKIRTILDNFNNKVNYHAYKIWSWYALELWYQTHIK